MKNTIVILSLLFITPTVMAQSVPPVEDARNQIRPFTTDGCSRFPDGIPFIEKHKWQKCCIQHDVAYWQGGTTTQRKTADDLLGACVKKTGVSLIGSAMSIGVRVGGAASLPTSWHWGYGWIVHRGYGSLTSEEISQVRDALSLSPVGLMETPIQSSPTFRQRTAAGPSGNHCIESAVLYLQKKLKRTVQITAVKETLQEGSSGYIATFSILTKDSVLPFDFAFQMFKADDCVTPMNELLARGRVRLLKAPQ